MTQAQINDKMVAALKGEGSIFEVCNAILDHANKTIYRKDGILTYTPESEWEENQRMADREYAYEMSNQQNH